MIRNLGEAGPDWMRCTVAGADRSQADRDRTSRRIASVIKPERTPAVYFASADGLVKVGRVARIENMQSRIQLLQTGCPHPIKVRLVVDHWGQSEEKAIHKLFKECHHRGEWFREEGRMGEFLRAVSADHEVAVAWLGLAICR